LAVLEMGSMCTPFSIHQYHTCPLFPLQPIQKKSINGLATSVEYLKRYATNSDEAVGNDKILLIIAASLWTEPLVSGARIRSMCHF